jgi:outer membrane protein assembly factor BamB
LEKKMMQISKTKLKGFIIALFLMLTITASSIMVALPIANAHTPPWKIPTYAFITANPNPVGVGQEVFVMFWLDRVVPGATGVSGDRYRNLNVEVTKPDGNKETLGPFTSDSIGGSFTKYTPDQTGTYNFTFTYPGQVLSLIGPNGLPGTANDNVNDTFLPSNATTTLTVQQEPIKSTPDTPLPTEYWARPIEGQNTVWATIASNWLCESYSVSTGHYFVQPDGIAPNSAHIMWTRVIQNGGVVGGSYDIDGVSYYSGASYEPKFQNPLIINGRLFYNLPLSDAVSGGGYICVDLQTGEEVWYSDKIGVTGSAAPGFGQLFNYDSMNQHGVIPNGYLWQVTGTTWSAYDSLTGKWLFNLTDVPSGGNIYGPNGEITRYILNYPGRWLALWNNTRQDMGLEAATGTGTNAYQFRPVGKTVNMSTAYSWNVTIPTLPNVGGSPTIQRIFPDDLLLGSFGTPGGLGDNPGCTMFAISLKPETRGTLLWIKNYTAPEGNLTRRYDLSDAESRVFIFYDKETMESTGYSLDDGSYLWGPIGGDARDFQTYTWSGHPENSGRTVAYGKLYVTGYGGLVYCYDMKNGTLLWTYGNGGSGNSTNCGIDAPWGNYPLFFGNIADGKLYLFPNEHSITSPYYKNLKIRCLNATTGEEIWAMMGYYGRGTGRMGGSAIADGYLAYSNEYDGKIYSIGKGPSTTTVDAPMTAITRGTSVVIRGTVTDIAAGTKQDEQAARFPNGVPAVSDDSMSAWMEYVYMQKPRPTNVTGVEVTIDVLDANNNYRNIGTATTDADGFYSFAWTTDIEGKYTVIASFTGSESYWPSHAETAFNVEEAQPQPTQQPAVAMPPVETYVLAGVIAIIIAIAIVGALLLMAIRKRP